MTAKYQSFLRSLKALARRAKTEGYSFAASVEFPIAKETHTVDVHVTVVGSAQALAHFAVRSNGNLDSLCIAAAKNLCRDGHNSIVLRLMGVKE